MCTPTVNCMQLTHLLYVISGIPYCICLSVKNYQISYSISSFLVQLFVLSPYCLLLSYSQLDQIFPNVSVTSYHICYNSSFSFCLVLVVSIYCISHLLVSATLFSLVLFSISYPYQTLLSFSNCISYFSKLFLSAYCITYQVVLSDNSTMYLYEVSYHLFVALILSLTDIYYPKKLLFPSTRINYLLCNYSISLLLIATLFLIATPNRYYCLSTTPQLLRLLLTDILILILSATPINHSL